MEPRTELPPSRRRRRRLVWLLLLLLALLVLIALVLWWFFRTPEIPVSVPPAALELPTATAEPTATPEPTPVPEPATADSLLCLDNECRHELEFPEVPDTWLEMVDDSLAYNWSVPSNTCLADIAAFMANEGIAMEWVSFTLLDVLPEPETETPVFYEFPPSDDPINDPAPDAGTAMCVLDADSNKRAYCQVAVSRIDEEMNDNARLALILVALDALRRVHYEQVTEDLEAYYLALAEALPRFVPVVREENGTWTTDCWDLLLP